MRSLRLKTVIAIVAVMASLVVVQPSAQARTVGVSASEEGDEAATDSPTEEQLQDEAIVQPLVDAWEEVTVYSASHSLDEMIAARDAILAQHPLAEGENGSLFTVDPDDEGRGMKVGINASSSDLAESAVERVVSEIADVAACSFEIGADQSVDLFTGGRQNDVSPHDGGASISALYGRVAPETSPTDAGARAGGS
ncbi:MAG: hypothetical protein QM622_02355 [Microbacterium sp.]